ncbi:MAG: peptidase, partial [Rhodothermales bacterium]
MHILFLFIDGVGLGVDDPSVNPFAALEFRALERLAGDQRWLRDVKPIREEEMVFVPLDANLGLAGLPQSGTGQATLFTGINCAQIAGRHYGPYPHSKTKPIIAEKNLFR